MTDHPITHFEAPSPIQYGPSLAALLSHRAIELIGENFGSSLNVEKFVAEGMESIGEMGSRSGDVSFDIQRKNKTQWRSQ